MLVQLITSDKVILEIQAKSVSLPGQCGIFEVLNNHEPMISLITDGLIEIRGVEDAHYNYMIAAGVVYANQMQCIILTTKCVTCEVKQALV